MKRIKLFLAASLFAFTSNAQDSTSQSLTSKIEWSGFADIYFSWADAGMNPAENLYFNHTSRDQVSLNMGMIKASYEGTDFRANFGLMAGSYVQNNLSHEPAAFRNIWEANLGYKIRDGLWIDAGVFASHLGFESAISTQNLTLTRSLVAENSPYYLSGVNLSYEANEKWTFLLNLSNGWQVMQKNNNALAGGTQIQFKPTSNLTFNYSTFFGDEFDFTGQTSFRLFNNFYAQLDAGDNFHAILGFDYGIQNSADWMGGALILAYDLNDKLSVAGRGEFFRDELGNVLSYASETLSGSLNLDVHLTDKLDFRIEGKWYERSPLIATTLFNQDGLMVFGSLAAEF